jgi:iron complex outermembrane receptor protein
MKHLVISFLCIAFTTVAGAQSEVVELPPYQVRSSLFGESIIVESLDVAPHAKGPTSDIASILQRSNPDVGIIRKAGTSNDIIVRGLSQDNVNVTIDDTKIFCACSNRMDPPISQVSTAMIERIDITQGAFDLSNSGSMGGSVRIHTISPSEIERLELAGSVGSFNHLTTHLLATGGTASLQSMASVEYTQSDPYEDGNGVSLTTFPISTEWPIDDYLEPASDELAFKAIHAAAKTQWLTSADTKLEVSYRYRSDEDVLYPGLRMDADKTLTHEVAIGYSSMGFDTGDGGFNIKVFGNWTDHDMVDSRRLSAQLNAMGRPRPGYVLERGFFMESIAYSATNGAHFAVKKDLGRVNFEYGAELLQRVWDIDNRLGAGTPTSGPQAEIFNNMIPNTKGTTLGAYLQAEFEFGETATLDMGARLDSFETQTRDDVSFLTAEQGAFDSEQSLHPSVKLLYRNSPTQQTSWFAGIGSTVRIPNGQERYIQLRRPGTMPNWLGNPELKTPRNTEIAVGGLYNTDRWYVRAKAFYSYLSDYIYTTRVQRTKPTQTYTNIDATLFGFDLSSSYNFGSGFNAQVGLSWQQGRKSGNQPPGSSKNLAEIPPAKLLAAIHYQSGNFEVALEGMHSWSQENVDTSLGEFPLVSFTVLGLRASYRFNQNFTVVAGVDNLTDASYAVHNAFVRNPFASFSVVNEPGRSWYLTLEASF